MQKMYGDKAYPKRHVILSVYQLINKNSNAILYCFEYSLMGPRQLPHQTIKKWNLLWLLAYPRVPPTDIALTILSTLSNMLMIIHLHKTIKNKPQKLLKPCAYTLVFDAYALARNKGMYHSISDNNTMVINNSATVHVCNNKSYFVGPMHTVRWEVWFWWSIRSRCKWHTWDRCVGTGKMMKEWNIHTPYKMSHTSQMLPWTCWA